MQTLLTSIYELRRDHALLCGELDVLKRAQNEDSPYLWQTLREVCARLLVGLREHVFRQEQLLVSSGYSLGAFTTPDPIISPSNSYYGDYRYLQVITRCIALESRPFLLRSRYLLLTNFIIGLDLNTQKQAAEFFPELDPKNNPTEIEA